MPEPTADLAPLPAAVRAEENAAVYAERNDATVRAERKRGRSFLVLVLGMAALAVTGCVAAAQTFTNPILHRPAADPSAAYVNGMYYEVRSGCVHSGTTPAICVRAAATLPELGKKDPVPVWSAPESGPNAKDVWAPEIEYLDGRWLIYYAADPDNNLHHRLFALVPKDETKPLGEWTEADTGAPHGQLVTDWKSDWAIDPSVFKATDGSYYLLYACRQDNSNTREGNAQSICMAAMEKDKLHLKPAAAGGHMVVALSQPTLAWERRGFPTEEGPFGVARKGVDYVFYSASYSGSPDQYAVGVLRNDHRSPERPGSGGMMNPAAWLKEGPVFDGHHMAYGTASTVLVPSPDGTEVWNVYHGTDCKSTCVQDAAHHTWAQRSIRVQRAEWADGGELVLGYPVDVRNEDGTGADVPLADPSTDRAPKPFRPWGPAFGDAAEGDAAAGQPAGRWQVTDAHTLENSGLGAQGRAQQFWNANPNWLDAVVSTDVQWKGTAAGDGAGARFGVYAAYVDKDNWVAAMIDFATCGSPGCVVTGGRSRGVALAWKSCPLSASFDRRAAHTLAVEVSHGSFEVYLNGDPLEGACQRVKDPEIDLRAGQDHDSNGQAGVLVENTRAAYTHFEVSPGVPQDSAAAGASYTLRNARTSLNLDACGAGCGGSAPGEPAGVSGEPPTTTYPLTIAPQQLWTLRSAGAGAFRIVSAATGLCVDAARSASAVTEASCGEAPSQIWRFVPAGGGFVLRSAASGLVLEAAARAGEALSLHSPSGAAAQRWELTAH